MTRGQSENRPDIIRPAYALKESAAFVDRHQPEILVVQVNVEATIVFAFILDLADSHLADFAGRIQMCASAGLKVDAFDIE